VLASSPRSTEEEKGEEAVLDIPTVTVIRNINEEQSRQLGAPVILWMLLVVFQALRTPRWSLEAWYMACAD